MRVLILSHFNIIRGPIEVLKIPEDFVSNEVKTIPKHLNLDEKDFFIYDYETFKTANLKFTIPSKMGRMDYEELMISVVIINEQISPKIFQSILKKLKEELKAIKNLNKVLYNSSQENAVKFLKIKEILLKNYQTIKNIKGIQLDINLNYDFPWGTHICYFYQKKEDLMDILIPYIKKGLENNQFCVWVTSEDLNEKEAKKKLQSEIKNYNEFLEKGQIEIFPYTEWYFKNGEFNFQRVLDGWVQKYNNAISHGFNGIRVTGNTAWIEKRDWKDFSDYEEEINNVVGNYRMIVLCTYSADKCSINEILGVMKTHQVATIRKEGKWEILQRYDSSAFN
ncbi:MAG: MEDS domain-containing protein [Promethearchaeota archaeon]|nr:MAG: MEDS domain-containing protein [Candidatus Lokiarchaeota archaeon]